MIKPIAGDAARWRIAAPSCIMLLARGKSRAANLARLAWLHMLPRGVEVFDAARRRIAYRMMSPIVTFRGFPPQMAGQSCQPGVPH